MFSQFVKDFKIFHFSSEINFWPLVIDIWRLFTGHTAFKRPGTGYLNPSSSGHRRRLVIIGVNLNQQELEFCVIANRGK